MKKMFVIASVLTALTAGAAVAQDFKVSNPNAAPGELGPEAVYTGGQPSIVTGTVGNSAAARDFHPSERNAAPGEVDNTIVTSSTQTVKRHVGYSAADSFGPSYDN